MWEHIGFVIVSNYCWHCSIFVDIMYNHTLGSEGMGQAEGGGGIMVMLLHCYGGNSGCCGALLYILFKL